VAVPEAKTRKPSLSVQLSTLRSKGAASAEFHPDGTLKAVSFSPPQPKPPADPKPTREQEVKFVPGTSIPDDKSPINPLDTLLNVPAFNAHEVS
jgi:hypothetical protein